MKNLRKNYTYNLIYQIVAIVTPIITAPYISRILGAENIGKYSYTQSIVSYIILLTTLGTTLYAQREIAFYQGDRKNQTKVFAEILIIRFGLGFLGILALLALILFYKQYRILFIIQSVDLLASMICIDWFYSGNEEFKVTMLRNLFIRIFNVVCIFAFVKTADDLYKYVLIIVFGTFLGNVSLWINVRRKLAKIDLSALSFKSHIVGSLSIFMAQISASIYSMLDKTMIGIITNSTFENGYYEQAQKIEKIGLTFVTALGNVLLPRVSKAFSDEDSKAVEHSLYLSFNYMWLIALPLTFGLAAIAPSFVPWFYGAGYEKTIILIQILAFLLVVIGISNIVGIQYLMATKKERLLTFCEIIGAVVNVVLNLILIPRMASVGAAIASVAAESAVAVAAMMFVRKEIHIKKMLFVSWRYVLASIMMYIVISIMRLSVMYHSTIISTMVLIITGGVVYLVVLILLKEKFLLGNIKSVIKSIMKK